MRLSRGLDYEVQAECCIELMGIFGMMGLACWRVFMLLAHTSSPHRNDSKSLILIILLRTEMGMEYVTSEQGGVDAE